MTQPICQTCGTPLPAASPAGLCPRCLLKRGMEAQTVGFTAPEPAARWLPPEVTELAALFPELEIIRLLGRGGMGAVYQARQKDLDRVVALKILPPEMGHDPAFAQRFTGEAQAMARLNHPHIVTLYEFGQRSGPSSVVSGPKERSPEILGETSGIPVPPAPLATDHCPRNAGLYFFIMEYVDGVNLRGLLDSGHVSPKEALAIVPQICEALQYAHEQGIVHRDIKPENILLSKQGVVKIADFGLAKLMGRTTAGAGEKVIGTPRYMAPEQLEHPADVDHRADIYSLGVVFYQMLTGELPAKRLEPPSHKVQIDVRLDQIVLRALEQSPELRFQNATQFKTEVETVTNTPTPIRPAGMTLGSDLEFALGKGKPVKLKFSKFIPLVGLREGTPVIHWLGVLLWSVLLVFPAFLVIGILHDMFHGPEWLLAFLMIPISYVVYRVRHDLRLPPERLATLDAPSPAPTSPPSNDPLHQARQALRIPAFCLAGAAVLITLIYSGLIFYLLDHSRWNYWSLIYVILLSAIVPNILLFGCAIDILYLARRRWAAAVCWVTILACLVRFFILSLIAGPFNLFCLTMAIWTLVLLNRTDIKAAFDANKSPISNSSALPKTSQLSLAIIALGLSILGLMAEMALLLNPAYKWWQISIATILSLSILNLIVLVAALILGIIARRRWAAKIAIILAAAAILWPLLNLRFTSIKPVPTAAMVSVEDSLIGTWEITKIENFKNFPAKGVLTLSRDHRFTTLAEVENLPLREQSGMWSVQGSYLHIMMNPQPNQSQSDTQIVRFVLNGDTLLIHEVNEENGPGIITFRRLASPSATAAFAPLIETVIPAAQEPDYLYTDLDTGQTHSAAERPKGTTINDDGEAFYWRQATGIDVTADIGPTTQSGRDGQVLPAYNGLVALDTRLALVDNSIWNSSPAEVQRFLDIHFAPRAIPASTGPSRAEVNSIPILSFPANFLFQTRQGRGILQMLGISDSPKGIKVRIRPLAASAASTSQPAFAPVIELAPRILNLSLPFDETAFAEAFINFHDGRLVPMPPPLIAQYKLNNADPAVLQWITSNIHANSLTRNGKPRVTCEGYNGFFALPVDNAAWDTLTPAALQARLESKLILRETDSAHNMEPPDQNPFPATFIFRSSSNDQGILQIMGYAATRDRLAIRYRLLAVASVTVIVSPTGLTFEGATTTWDRLPGLLEKIPNRPHTILALKLASRDMTLAQHEEALSRITVLARQYNFRNASDTGIVSPPPQ